ncbi:amidohydrolase family protein [Colwellia sp. M166]|uniref:amidohydrolase n=1 Tax=Colwellia sp. M166 TaxID=2583805 RepID=UPI00211E16A6|nr:amidohydrolase family protein [Colwellia sp. M166]UUO24733.1 amidohydrolase family protein [Colwellia sp. M166]
MKTLSYAIKAVLLLAAISPTIVLAKTTLIKNIQGYTITNNALERFTAITFTDDKIDQLYTGADPLPTSKNINIIDGQGKTLLPGLIDSHGHILNYGLSLLRADLVNSISEQDAVNRTFSYAKSNTELTWIQGRGWNQTQWPSNTFPSAKSLDVLFPNQPVWLKRIDGHAGWANSKAMAIAGINKATLSPEGGEIIKDENGLPTGVFIDNAMALIDNSIAPLSIKQQKQVLIKAMDSLASYGLTSVHDAGIDTDNLNAFKELSQENAMSIRVNAMLYLPSANWQETLTKGQFRSKDDMFTFNSVKIQADGALGSRGAALIEDYSDHSGHKGLLLNTPKEFQQLVNTSMKLGFQVNSHAIGDNANKLVLDTYEAQIKATDTKALRHRVEHAQVLRLEDIPRFSELGVIAAMQATHATSDKNMAQDRIGPSRILGAYAWRKLLAANAIIAAGSDFPVESPNPFYGLHASITRQDHSNSPKDGWFADEKMTPLEAFRSFTLDAAYAGHQEQIIGSLATGKKADFVLLEQNLFTMPEQDIWKITVNKTWVNGKLVYKK